MSYKIKDKITMPQLKNWYDIIISVPYGRAQTLLAPLNPTYYNSGRYGWNYDVYEFWGEDVGANVAVITGYRYPEHICRGCVHDKYYERLALELENRYNDGSITYQKYQSLALQNAIDWVQREVLDYGC